MASSDPVAVELRGNFTFTVIPVLNPDGYAYTRTKDRLWRKNRQPNAKSRCIGQDPNRNFGFKWDMGGASRNPCMENYEGDSPFQSQEAKALIDYIQGLGNVVSYLGNSISLIYSLQTLI